MGSLARKARKLGIACSSTELRPPDRNSRRWKRAQAVERERRRLPEFPLLDPPYGSSPPEWARPDRSQKELEERTRGDGAFALPDGARLEFLEPSRGAWDVFTEDVGESEKAIRSALLGQSDIEPPLTLRPGSTIPVRPAAPPILVDYRNEPLERLEALAKSHPDLVEMAKSVVVRPIAQLVQAAQDREVEIIKARRAAELGAVVLADGGMVPRDEAELVEDRWQRRDPPRSPMRAVQLLALVAGLAASAGLPPRGSR
jgi:hypothetical protein